MVHRLSSPPLIKGIDGIVSRSPNEVNYSTLDTKSMETRNQLGKEKSRKSKKYERSGNMAKDVKKDENAGKIKILNSRVNENAIDMMDKVEDDGEDDGVTIEAQQRKFKKYGLRQKERYVKENAGKYKYLMKLAKTYGCEIPMIKKDVESDGNKKTTRKEIQKNLNTDLCEGKCR